ncbi:MAG: hypothetical protein R3293_25745, partial [Candidatus Promineifilaceae bacterium]|nr:hypothetical protein [Candidatus Promineifilaceae bacterium]
KKAIGTGLMVIIAVGLVKNLASAWSGETTAARNEETTAEIEALAPVSLQLVDAAIADLSLGWSGMSQSQRETFLLMYDPARTGDVDDAYVEQVLANYYKIRQTLAGEIAVAYAPDNENCEGQRLYFTDLTRLYVCPYFFEEANQLRKARTLIHEAAHIALLAVDRAYYRPTSKQYAQLTPNGSPLTRLPLAGRLLRELLRGDTLFHPDAYAHFALQNAGFTNIYAKDL